MLLYLCDYRYFKTLLLNSMSYWIVYHMVCHWLIQNNNNNNDRLTAFDPGQPG